MQAFRLFAVFSFLLVFCCRSVVLNASEDRVAITPVDVAEMNLRGFEEYQDKINTAKDDGWGGVIRVVAKDPEGSDAWHCVVLYWKRRPDGGDSTAVQIISWAHGEESRKRITEMDEKEGESLLAKVDASEFFSLCGNRVRRSLQSPEGGRVLYAEESRLGETKRCARYISESEPARILLESLTQAVQTAGKAH